MKSNLQRPFFYLPLILLTFTVSSATANICTQQDRCVQAAVAFSHKLATGWKTCTKGLNGGQEVYYIDARTAYYGPGGKCYARVKTHDAPFHSVICWNPDEPINGWSNCYTFATMKTALTAC